MPRPTNHELLNTLNDLLSALGTSPPSISTIIELRPALLVSILEAILQTPLSDLDLSFSSPSKSTSSIEDEEELLDLQRTKLFLGILETDVLELDVGLSNIDPRRLARGMEDELSLIAELLCWVGKRHNFIPSAPKAKPRLDSNPQPLLASPSNRRSPLSPTTTAVTATVISHSPPHRHSSSLISNDDIVTPTPVSTRKTRPRSPSDGLVDLSASFSPPMASSPPPRPSRPKVAHNALVKNKSFLSNPSHRSTSSPITSSAPPTTLSSHQLSPPSTPKRGSRSKPTSPRIAPVTSPLASSSQLSPPSTPKRSTRSNDTTLRSPFTSPRAKAKAKDKSPVRYDGWISPVDEELELLSFESSRQHISLDGAMMTSPTNAKSSSREKTTEETNGDLETARITNIRLLEERARLLEELSKLGITA